MNQPKFGDILYRSKLLVQHVGIMLDGGKVLHNSPKNGVEICALKEYSKGKEVKVVSSDLDVDQQISFKQKAIAMVEQGREYNLFDFNCEHLVSLVKSGHKYSPQLAGAVIGASVGAIAANKSKNPFFVIAACSIAGLMAQNIFREYDYSVN